jgi:hypothetical protein
MVKELEEAHKRDWVDNDGNDDDGMMARKIEKRWQKEKKIQTKEVNFRKRQE